MTQSNMREYDGRLDRPVAVLHLDASGRVVHVFPDEGAADAVAWCALHQRLWEYDVWSDDAAARLAAAFGTCRKGGGPRRILGRARIGSGSFSLLEVLLVPCEEHVEALVFGPPRNLVSSLLARIGYEIRSPMNAILGMAQVLEGADLSAEYAQCLEGIVHGANAMIEVVSDIADLAQLEAGTLVLNRDPIGFGRLVRDIDAQLVERVEAAGLTFHSETTTEWNEAVGDPSRIRQLVTNLVDFAVHNGRGGNVLLCYSGENGPEGLVWRCAITHTGLTLSREVIESLQGGDVNWESPALRTIGGSSLRMVTTYALLRNMGGRLFVEPSQSDGTTVTVEIPLEASSGASAHVLAVRGVAEDQCYKVLVCGEHVLSEASDARCMLETTVAVTGDEIFDALRKRSAAGDPFDVCLVDLDVRYAADGVADRFAEHLLPLWRAVNPHTVFVAAAAVGVRGDAQHMREMGVEVYLPKPVTARMLVDAVDMALAQRSRSVSEGPVTRFTLTDELRKGVRILLVEDNAVNQQVAMKMLEKLGFTGTLAADGAEAVSVLSQERFDIVLMDIQMPRMDGVLATRTIRDPSSPVLDHSVPIVAMTAHTGDEGNGAYLGVGMNDVLLKPISIDALEMVLGRWVGYAQERGRDHSDAAPLFDRDALLEQLLGDEQTYRDLVASYVEDTSTQLERLRDLLSRKALADIAAVARSVSSASCDVTASAVTSAARQLEVAAQSRDVGRLGELVEQLATQFERTRSVMG